MGIATAKGRSRAENENVVEVPARAWQLLAAHPVAICTAWGGRRFASLALGAQQASNLPPLVCVSSRCGHVIDPVLRDARVFSLCVLGPAERVMLRRLSEGTLLRGMDIFDGIAVDRLQGGLPAVASSPVALECEIVRHIDLEADHQLYVGKITSCRVREMMQAAC
ncbi:MAG TPA: flavin reductase [Phycisphaerales bacterium]|nr:flavin reductase [Phycisphaerales bacterium]